MAPAIDHVDIEGQMPTRLASFLHGELGSIHLKKSFTFGLLVLAGFLVPAHADNLSLKTISGFDIGGQISSYKYEETDPNGNFFMSLEGSKIGATGSYTRALNNNWYWMADGRFAAGSTNYTSAATGSKGSNPDRYLDLRFLVGRDCEVGNYVLTPFAGAGYRTLYNDLTGYTSTGNIGYRRTSRYAYLPLGLTHRFHVNDQARVATTLEYDYLLEGTQRSYTTDISGYTSDLVNTQRNGYGLRLNVAYETMPWSVGVFYHYWNIQDSDVGTYTDATRVYSGIEPRNTTKEVGIQIRYRFH